MTVAVGGLVRWGLRRRVCGGSSRKGVGCVGAVGGGWSGGRVEE